MVPNAVLEALRAGTRQIERSRFSKARDRIA
jgi:hypothetical protein